MSQHFDVYAVIDRIRPKPAMWLGTHSLTLLRAFLDGCIFAAVECGAESVGKPDFGGLHDWVAIRFGWKESTTGWCNIILDECGGDEPKALALFFELIDEYRASRTARPLI